MNKDRWYMPAAKEVSTIVNGRFEARNTSRRLVEETLKTILQDKFHQGPSSKHWRTMIFISQQLLAVNLLVLQILLVSSTAPLFSSSTDFCSSLFLLCVSNLRNNPDFIESLLDFILSNANFKLELRFAKMFAQRFCTCLHTCLRLALGELTGLEFCCTTEFWSSYLPSGHHQETQSCVISSDHETQTEPAQHISIETQTDMTGTFLDQLNAETVTMNEEIII